MQSLLIRSYSDCPDCISNAPQPRKMRLVRYTAICVLVLVASVLGGAAFYIIRQQEMEAVRTHHVQAVTGVFSRDRFIFS